jgi:hypothetical protein
VPDVFELTEDPMKKGIAVLIVTLLILGCTAGRNESQKADLEKLEVGETVFVCGCPMMCCNSISRTPGGRCDCNQPLKKGTVSAIRNGRVVVRIDDGREKRFFINKN